MIHRLSRFRQFDVLERRPKLVTTVVFVIALLLCTWICGRWLWVRDLPRSGAEDLAKHVAMALNFRAALAAGQPLPRLQTNGDLLECMPVFQYYGFFEGLVAWPFLKLGLRGLQAVTVAIVLLRWGAFAFVFMTGRVLRAGSAVSALAGFAYVLSPYIINNELSRVAIAEVHAHSLLPLCLLGWAMIVRGWRPSGVIVLAVGMAALALAHNIFFLYTALLLCILFLFCFPDWRSALALTLGGLCGLLVAAPQWYPAMLSQPDLVVNFFDRKMPFFYVTLISFSGLWGWLQPYKVSMPGGVATYYFTFAWWTLLAAAGLLWSIRADRERRRLSVALLAAGTAFFLLVVPPVDFWAVLPPPFSAVQFTYRLIAYVALLSALGLAMAFPRLPWVAVLVLLPIMVFSQWPAIHTALFPFGKMAFSDTQIASTFASYDYVCTSPPKSLPSEITYTDGMLAEKNHFRPQPAGAGSKPALQLTGYNSSVTPLRLRLVPLDPAGQVIAVPIPNTVLLPSGAFSVVLSVDARFPEQRIVCDSPDQESSADGASLLQMVRLRSVVQREDAKDLLLPSECLEEVDGHTGYDRTYRISPVQVAMFSPLGRLRHGDGWLREDNLIDSKPRVLRLQGANPMRWVVRLYGANPAEPDKPLTPIVEIPPGGFDVTLPLSGLPLPLRLYFSPTMTPHTVNPVSTDYRKLALLLVDNGEMLNDYSFSSFIIQTPIAYNRFWEVLHDGQPVQTFSDLNYHLCVALKQPSGTLMIRYHLPLMCWVLCAAGLLIGCCQWLLWKKLPHELISPRG